MASLRWRKLAGDLRAMPGRLVAMVLALAISLVGPTDAHWQRHAFIRRGTLDHHRRAGNGFAGGVDDHA